MPQRQNVTVRFTPTQPALSNSNVTFSAAGDAISRLVAGTGIALDTTPPMITIIAPT